MHNEAHAARWRERTLAEILARMRHDGCGGRPGRVQLLTGIEDAGQTRTAGRGNKGGRRSPSAIVGSAHIATGARAALRLAGLIGNCR
jgi:hypothetical protein